MHFWVRRSGLLVLSLILFSAMGHAGVTLASLGGTWTNINTSTRDIVKIEIGNSGVNVNAHVWGACEPTPCDWGVKNGIAYSNDVGQPVVSNTDYISVIFPQGFADRILVIRPIGGEEIQVITLNQFTDGSGRSNYSTVETFRKEIRSVLAAPVLLSPKCGSVFSIFPRTTHLQWEAVPGATSYTVEIDCFDCCVDGKWCTDVGRTWLVVPNIRTLSYTFDFVGAQPGRWRVWAAGGGRLEGFKSGWCEFRYTK